jgi:hypothetical protein
MNKINRETTSIILSICGWVCGMLALGLPAFTLVAGVCGAFSLSVSYFRHNFMVRRNYTINK